METEDEIQQEVRELIGEDTLRIVTDFARAKLRTVPELEAREFGHIDHRPLRRRLAQVFYGTRWIYKVALCQLSSREERAAAIRTQIIDYAAVTEGLLSHCVAHAFRYRYVKNEGYLYGAPWREDRKENPLDEWDFDDPEPRLRALSYGWHIFVARDFEIIDKGLREDDGGLKLELDELRKGRNRVHIRQESDPGEDTVPSELERQDFDVQSKLAFQTAMETIRQTQAWKRDHPKPESRSTVLDPNGE